METRKNKLTSKETRERIVKAYRNRPNMKEIAIILNKKHSTVRSILKKIEPLGQLVLLLELPQTQGSSKKSTLKACVVGYMKITYQSH